MEFCSVSRKILFDIFEMALDEIRYTKLCYAANVSWRLYINRRLSESNGLEVLSAGLIFEGDGTSSCCAYFSIKMIPFQLTFREYSSAYQIKMFSEENSVHETWNSGIFWTHITESRIC